MIAQIEDGARQLGSSVEGEAKIGSRLRGPDLLGKLMPSFDFGASRAKVGQSIDGMREPSGPPRKSVD
jgi:hypothetical protein